MHSSVSVGWKQGPVQTRTFHEPNLIHWIKCMKSSAPESIRNAYFNLERLSRSSRLARREVKWRLGQMTLNSAEGEDRQTLEEVVPIVHVFIDDSLTIVSSHCLKKQKYCTVRSTLPPSYIERTYWREMYLNSPYLICFLSFLLSVFTMFTYHTLALFSKIRWRACARVVVLSISASATIETGAAGTFIKLWDVKTNTLITRAIDVKWHKFSKMRANEQI